jgi:hypothetical protein
MRVRCASNSGSRLPEEYLDPAANLHRSTNFPLTIGAEYAVYAVLIRPGGVWFQLSDDNELPYPMAYPAPLFDIVDGRPSRHWTFALTTDHADHLALFAIPEWTADRYFYDRLTNGAQRDVAIFSRAKAMMDAE